MKIVRLNVATKQYEDCGADEPLAPFTKHALLLQIHMSSQRLARNAQELLIFSKRDIQMIDRLAKKVFGNMVVISKESGLLQNGVQLLLETITQGGYLVAKLIPANGDPSLQVVDMSTSTCAIGLRHES